MHVEQGLRQAANAASALDVCEHRGRACTDNVVSKQGNVLAGPIYLSLSTGLSLLSKQHNSSFYSPGSSTAKGSDQLLPIVQRFLESLPSVGKAWSFDAASTVHSLGDVNEDVDSISCCSCSSHKLRCPVSAAARRKTYSGRCPPPAAVDAIAADAQHSTARSRFPPRQLALSSTMDESREAGSPKHGSAAPFRSAVKCLNFAESTGSAPTPSPAKAAVEAADADAVPSSVSSCSRRGVFVGNLPGDVNERTLVELFSRCGRIDRLWIARNAANQASLGYGFVVFDTCGGSQAAKLAEQQLDGTSLQQQSICVRVSTRSF